MSKRIINIILCMLVSYVISATYIKYKNKYILNEVKQSYQEIYDRLETACQNEQPFHLRGKIYACFDVEQKCEVQDD